MTKNDHSVLLLCLNNLRILRFREEGDMFRFDFYRLIEKLFEESMILFIILAICHGKPIIPCSWMKLESLFGLVTFRLFNLYPIINVSIFTCRVIPLKITRSDIYLIIGLCGHYISLFLGTSIHPLYFTSRIELILHWSIIMHGW